jgi:beta-glucosidase
MPPTSAVSDHSGGFDTTRREFLDRIGCAVATIAAGLSAPILSAAARVDGGHAGRGEAETVESLLGRMTLEEKLGQLSQMPGRTSATDPHLPEGTEQRIRAGGVGSFLGVYGAAETKRLQRMAVEESRLGTPLLFAEDVIHGFRTVFPVPLGEAASFDVAAVEGAARVAAVEAAAHGLHWTFAPMVDIARDPRWGRIVEGSGEDPYLGATLAGARVRGFQGSDLSADDTLLATAKHFVAYGAAEGGRDYNTAEVSERTLREVYLAPFRAAASAGVQVVMVAFNDVAGIPMHANRRLVRDVLRGELAFKGVVISDYLGISELIAHGVAADPQAAGVLALRAGIDVDMVSNVYLEHMSGAVASGTALLCDIDEAVRHVLRAKYRVGLFDDPYRYCNVDRQRARTLKPEHRRLAREMARKSFVLLKNEGNVLPFSKALQSVAVIGPLADNRRAMLGSWVGAGRPEDVVSPIDGIRTLVGAHTRVLYAEGTSTEGSETSGFAEAETVARAADAVLLFVGEDGDMTGEARSRSSLALPGAQEALVLRVLAAGKPTAVVLFSGRPLSIGVLAERVASVLLAWFPGVEAGHALADVLFGDASPSGRLPVTFPRAVGQIPTYYDHTSTGRPPDPLEEDARRGGKNTSRYFDLPPTPLYAFGHGLSYTTFSYDDLSVHPGRIGITGRLEVRVAITNTGTRAAAEVAQLYVHQQVASVVRPVRALRGFQRVDLLPGERRVLRFELGPEDLALVGQSLASIVEPGAFSVLVGGSPSALIETAFEVTGGPI